MFMQPSDPAYRPVRFEMRADADPGVLVRALATFARRDLMPDRVRARRDGDAVAIEIGMDAMPAEMLHLVEGNLRQIVGVSRVAVVLYDGRLKAA